MKILDFDNNNSNVYCYFSVETDTDESLDPLRSIGILSVHNCSATLSSPSHSSPFCQISFKKNQAKLKLSLCFERINLKHKRGCFGDLCINFTTRLMVVNSPSADWLSDLRIVEGICGQSFFAKQVIFLSAVLLNKFVFA